jgi:transcriptional regulator with XRE-family HTH domain
MWEILYLPEAEQ